MKVIIELSAFELKEANKRGILDALASLEAAEGKPDAVLQAETEQQPVPVPTPPVQPAAAAPAPPQPVPTRVPIDVPPAQVMQQPAVPIQTAVPTEETSYTMEQLAKAATQIVDAKGQQAILDLLGRFQVQALTELPKVQYGAFATELRAQGAKI